MGAEETRRATLLEAIRETLAERPDGVLERVAEAHGAPLQMVVEALPETERVFVPGERFAEVWASIGAWGEVLLLVHTRSALLEVVGRLAPGTVAGG
jgi:putative heme iron utilization protein